MLKRKTLNSLRAKGLCFVPETGLEPARRETHAPETCASTNSAIRAWKAGANIAFLCVPRPIPP